MAVGRQDYQAGVVPIKSGYSLMQSPYFDNETHLVAAAADDEFCNYTVSAGYQLMICGYRLSSNLPFQQIYVLIVGGTVQIQNHFDMALMDNFPDNSPLKVAAGEEVKITIYNSDSVVHWFAATIFGYLEQIES